MKTLFSFLIFILIFVAQSVAMLSIVYTGNAGEAFTLIGLTAGLLITAFNICDLIWRKF